MYTISSRYNHHLSVFFLENGIESWITFDSQEAEKTLKPEVLGKIQDFAEKVLAVFERQPENVKSFLANLNDIKESVFSNPELFRIFLNKAYEKHSEDVASLQWSQRSKKISDFSDFVSDIMLQIADKQQVPRLSLAIRAQKLALESKTKQEQLIAKMGLHSLQEELA